MMGIVLGLIKMMCLVPMTVSDKNSSRYLHTIHPTHIATNYLRIYILCKTLIILLPGLLFPSHVQTLLILDFHCMNNIFYIDRINITQTLFTYRNDIRKKREIGGKL